MTDIFCEIDLDAEGKHFGCLRVPHSVHRSAYGWIPVPIASIKNGSGPVALLMAGNHGDEYEGQVVLSNLIRTIRCQDIQGQLLILTMANFPAAKAGLRTSPLDQGNLNRSFPGDAKGTPTQMIAHYIESVLLTRADYLLDIHSGGSSLLYRPTLLMPDSADPKVRARNLRLLRSFGFPTVILYPEQTRGSYSSSAALRNGAIPITAEMAGAGSVTHSAVKRLESGLDGYLSQIGIKKSGAHTISSQTITPLEIPSQDYYVYGRTEGVFEPILDIGDHVSEGQLLGVIHHPETPYREPDKILSTVTGQVVCIRVPARVEFGDCLFELARRIVD